MKNLIAILVTCAGICAAAAITGTVGILRDMGKEINSINARLIRIETKLDNK